MVKIKRVYDQPERGDGERILVDRLWPRGLSRKAAAIDRWMKDLGPSDELLIRDEARRARIWRYSWLGINAALMIGSFVAVPLVDDAERPDWVVSGAGSAINLARLLRCRSCNRPSISSVPLRIPRRAFEPPTLAIVAVTSQVASQRARLHLVLDQFDERRRVEIELHCSSARIAARAEDASMP